MERREGSRGREGGQTDGGSLKGGGGGRRLRAHESEVTASQVSDDQIRSDQIGDLVLLTPSGLLARCFVSID